MAAVFEKLLNLTEYPGAALRTAAYHQCVCARVMKNVLRALRRVDIAVGDNGNSYCLFDGGNRVVFHCALEATLASSPVDSEKLNATVFGYFCDFDTVARLGTPAGADFKRDRNIHRADYCAKDPFDQVSVA